MTSTSLERTPQRLTCDPIRLGERPCVSFGVVARMCARIDSQVQGLITAMAQFGAVSALAAAETGSLTKQAHDSSMISHLAASAWR